MLVVGETLGETFSLYYLHIILVLGAFQGLCGVWIISTLDVPISMNYCPSPQRRRSSTKN
jgi:hypothetical protein